MAATRSSTSLSADFWKFWLGQAVSSLGDSFSGFALPLLVYNLTGSAINLALTSAAYMLPYLLFGLFIGAWADRLDRKRLMIVVDIGRAAALATIPIFATFDILSVWWIYAISFITSTLGIFFDSAQFAAIPSLVQVKEDLVTANGRIEASYSAARIIGPLLAGLLVTFIPLYDLIFIDAASFLASALSLALIARSFNAARERARSSVRQDVVEGLRYVLKHPVLRNISLMMALVNFVMATTHAQRVLFAKEALHATDAELGLLYSANSIGVIVLSLAAGQFRKRWPFSRVALGSLMAEGLILVVLAFTPYFWLSLPLWALMSGFGTMFNINTGSLRQAIVPNHMLGRIRSIAGVLAWSAIPLGSLAGGWIIEDTGNVALVFAAIGGLSILIPFVFSFTPLGRAEQYLPPPEQQAAAQVAPSASPAPTGLRDEQPRQEPSN